ncbi:MAG: hypothetical protein GQ574_07825 [Crocinitomix sp.]|nr:hypothetical protein [Crocinitomix sp.]
MLFSSNGFLILIGISVIVIGGSIYWFLHEKKKVAFNISAGSGAIAAVVVGVIFFSLRTTIIVIEDEVASQYSMLGSVEFEFKDGTKETIPKLERGDLIINNSVDTCVIIRADYSDDLTDESQELINIMFAVQPHSIFALHGDEIDYLFSPSPEYLSVEESSSRTYVKYELQYITSEYWDTYYLYDGPVVNGIPNGVGKFYFSPTSYYEGDHVNAKFEGEGKLIYDESDWYEGEYENDERSGQGFYQYPDGTTYQGEWAADEKEGTGTQYYYNDDIYEGDFVNGELHGEGKYLFASGDYYEGEFVNGYFQGKGKWYYSGTDTFKYGTWFEDDYQGE